MQQGYVFSHSGKTFVLAQRRVQGSDITPLFLHCASGQLAALLLHVRWVGRLRGEEIRALCRRNACYLLVRATTSVTLKSCNDKTFLKEENMLKRFLATLPLLAAIALPSFGQTLQSIQTVPSIIAAFPGEQYAVQVLGNYSDGSQQDLTSSATFSSDSTYVQVTNAQPQITADTISGQGRTATVTASVPSGLGVVLATVEVDVVPGVNPSGILPPGSIVFRGGNLGAPPFSTFQGSGVDSLNLATDNILINIPVRLKNEIIPFSFSLVGNSSARVPNPPQQNYWQVSNGISGQVGGMLDLQVTHSTTIRNCQGLKYDQEYSNFGIIDASGAVHALPGMPIMDSGVWLNGSVFHCDHISGSSGANDNSGLSATYYVNPPTGTPQWTIYNSIDGSRVAPLTTGRTVTDKYGNTMSYVPSSGGYTVKDSEGVSVLTATLQATADGSVDKYQYIDFNGNTQTYEVTWKAYTEWTQFNCSGGTDIHATTKTYILPHTITIPQMPGDSAPGVYTLDYESTAGGTSGRLANITYPTGGYTSYDYGSTPINCNDMLTVPVLTRKVTDTTSGITGTWTYNTSTVTYSNNTVTETNAAGNTETYHFSDAYVTEHNIASLLDTYICYNGNSGQSSCVTPSTSNVPGTIVTQTDMYSSANNGAANTYNHVQTLYSGVGEEPTQITSWDLPGTGTAKTQTTMVYQSINGASLPTTTTTVDPTQSGNCSGHLCMAQTVLSYNTKGALTQKQNWVSGTKYLTTIYGPNSNGTPGTVTDPNGTITTMHYDSSCGGLVPTSVTNNANSLTSSIALDTGCRQGVAVNQTSVSGQESSQTYGDPLFRMDSHTDESGTVVSTNYRLNRVTTTQPFNGGTLTHVRTLDGLGRVVNNQTYNGSTYDTVQTSYDSMERVSFVSVPFSCATVGGCSYTTGTNTTYDAASRVHTITNANNGVTTYTYTAGPAGADVTSVLTPTPSGDQSANGKARVQEFDGLGRLKSVCEVNAFSDKTACGQTISSNGYITAYTHDALGNLTGVTQGPAGSQQTRTFYYDGLSRLINEANPENGTTAYYFDADPTNCGNSSPGGLASLRRNKATIVCYWYDGLHRLIAKSFPGGGANDRNEFFAWDSTTLGNGQKVGQGGKIAEAYTCPNGVSWCTTGRPTDEGFQYDARGDITGYYQTSTHSGGWYGIALAYDALNNVNSLSGIPGVGTISIGSYDPEGRPTKIVSSSFGAVASNITYGYFGALSVTYEGTGHYDTFSFDQIGNMTKFYTEMNSSSYSGSPSWNYNGTLKSLTTVDSISGNGGATNTVVTYNYDDLGRLWKATDTGTGANLSQTYALDKYGNISTSGSPASWMPTYASPNNNQYQPVSTCGNSGAIGYDADGDLLCDSFHTYVWDSEDKLVSVDGGTAIVYDAFGRAVENGVYEYIQAPKIPPVQMSGQTTDAARIPLPGGANAVFYENGVYGYEHRDWIGAVRTVTGFFGTGLLSQTEYSPFGIPFASTTNPWLTFDGGLQNTASGEYDTPNRELHGVQGRWTKPDPAGRKAVDVTNPQSWNRYAYARNNPLSYTDPTGLYVCEDSTECSSDYDKKFADQLANAQTAANVLKDQYGADSSQYQDAQRAIDAYGEEGVDNGVNVRFDSNLNTTGVTEVSGVAGQKTADNPTGQTINVTLNPSNLSSDGEAGLVAHEGSHVADASAWVASGFSSKMNPTQYQTEINAYRTQFYIYQAQGFMGPSSLPITMTFHGNTFLFGYPGATVKDMLPEWREMLASPPYGTTYQDSTKAFCAGCVLQP